MCLYSKLSILEELNNSLLESGDLTDSQKNESQEVKALIEKNKMLLLSLEKRQQIAERKANINFYNLAKKEAFEEKEKARLVSSRWTTTNAGCEEDDVRFLECTFYDVQNKEFFTKIYSAGEFSAQNQIKREREALAAQKRYELTKEKFRFALSF